MADTATIKAGTAGDDIDIVGDDTTDGFAEGVKLLESAAGSVTFVDVGGLLTAIKTAVELIDNMISGSEGQVDVVSSALPTGAATAANQATIAGHLDGVETLLGAIQTAAEAIETAVEGTLAISGSTTVSGTIGITKAGAAARTSVASGTSNVTILAANANRLGASIYNDDANDLYLGMGGTDVTATNYTVIVPSDGYFELPFGYTGIIEGLWASDGSGSARVTEYTAS